MPRLARFAPPPRYAVLAWVAALFLLISLLTRLGLLVFEADPANFDPRRALPLLAIGLLYDMAAASYWLVPFALIALWFPGGRTGRKAHAWAVSALVLGAVFVMLCTAFAEVVFWNEFSSRFNFIAVDYLIYTRETLGNIRESYPIGLMVGGTAALAVICYLVVRKPVWRAAAAEAGPFSRRLLATFVVILLPVASFLVLGDAPRDALPTASARELAGNGYYDFGRAFRANDLDYQTFYRTMPDADAEQLLRHEFADANSTAVFTGGSHPLERQVTAAGPANPLNVVLVTIESLGSDFVESFGGKPGLTPNLDRLGAEGLRFTSLYATGTRTVRGLEALSLSVPPTPGHAVLTRKNNKGFQTLGGVLKEQGYAPLFIYGGYSYFDNMNDFFGGNGYTVVDRTSLARSEISHETIWGVADEDLFKMVTREMDARTGSGQKVFAHVMTTSNHRPYTFPEGRIDLPSKKSGRDGTVKYTDWAIGNFMREAATRPWYKNTLFVFIADHTSHGRGRTDLPPENYRIPLIVYAPGLLAPRTIDSVASQIDVGPTILGLLNVSYTSRFFGQDILTEGQHHQRALMANYLTVGHMEEGVVVELSPKRRARVLEAGTGRELPADNEAGISAIEEAIAYYQVADQVLRDGPDGEKP